VADDVRPPDAGGVEQGDGVRHELGQGVRPPSPGAGAGGAPPLVGGEHPHAAPREAVGHGVEGGAVLGEAVQAQRHGGTREVGADVGDVEAQP
jgi:hypothetical protein